MVNITTLTVDDFQAMYLIVDSSLTQFVQLDAAGKLQVYNTMTASQVDKIIELGNILDAYKSSV